MQNIAAFRKARKDLGLLIARFIASPEEIAPGAGGFNDIALALFEHQYRHMQPYRNLCDATGAVPGKVRHWRSIPPVITSAFRVRRMFCGPPGDIEHEFSTSGTTGSASRGRSCFSPDGLELMKVSIETNARKMIFHGPDRVHILVLAPSPAIAPQMIMAWGMARLIELFGTPRSGFLFGPDGLDTAGLVEKLRRFEKADEKVVLIGASFGFVNLLEGFAARGVVFSLPPGSRTMDAGGYKGKSREVGRKELEEMILRGLGVEPASAVNLLGMTELASQFYDDTIEKSVSGGSPSGLKQNPPWTRTRAVDPVTLEDVPGREPGALLHLDLANLDIPMCVLTDDGGRVLDGGFEITGRLSEDGSRGCSLTIDELSGELK